MIFGRPSNLVLGAITAIFNVVVVASHTVPGLENIGLILNDVLVSTVNLALGAVIALIANQPPSLSPGDTFTKVNPGATPNETVTVKA
jgi:hypothetical protein